MILPEANASTTRSVFRRRTSLGLFRSHSMFGFTRARWRNGVSRRRRFDKSDPSWRRKWIVIAPVTTVPNAVVGASYNVEISYFGVYVRVRDGTGALDATVHVGVPETASAWQ